MQHCALLLIIIRFRKLDQSEISFSVLWLLAHISLILKDTPVSEYGTAIGVNPIMYNALENLQNKLAMKCNIQNHVLYPPFQEIVKLIHEVNVPLNGPGFPFES